MKTRRLRAAVLASATLISVPALAQSSVTLFGIVDAGLSYQNSQTTLGSTSNGHSAVKTTSGVWAGSRFGFKGAEDLGGGTKAIFWLENGFSSNTGAQMFGGLFGRQAYVGLTNDQYGSFTAGRQYSSYYLLLLPYAPTRWLTGAVGAHPGDIDGLDTTYRINNALQYTSPKLYGFTLSGTYALGGVAGAFNQGSTWSAALQYATGPVGVAAGVLRINNSTLGGGAWGADSTTNSGGLPGVSAINNGYQTAAAQQRVAVTAGYELTTTLGVSASYANVQFIPGTGSKFKSTAIFNVVGAVIHWLPTPALQLGAGYSYTRATEANGITDPAQYHQITLAESYSLSKRTSVYALQGYTHAHGKTLGTAGASSIINATATVGDGYNATPSSTNGQFVFSAGLITRF
ncbi:putative porin [Paraburkholderia sp. BL27I4N3]|uniref:porin n=1 Tax=Paraburkholderia sp. BL27I4N3 TaxID=1938805 RepID=UPI000E230848|nr:porin [Paraburkholderia sp. BL27I4N3]REE17733.1 putative porin [Paraburkholderia sp. BL27I4N3]